MRIEVKEGMEFYTKENKFAFKVVKNDFYGDEDIIFCADDGSFIYPIGEIMLSDYVPLIDGKLIFGKNEYINI